MPYKDLPRHEILARRANLAGVALTPAQMKDALASLASSGKGFAMTSQLGGENVPRDRTYWVRTFANLLQAAGVEGDLPALATGMCDTFLITEDFYLDAETLPTLRGLKERGYVVGVISNAPKGLARTLDKYGVLPALDFAVGSQDIGIEKPDPAIFHHALCGVGVQASEAAYVGDEYETDAQAASNVGMLGIFLDRDNHRPASILPRIRRLSDLLGPSSPL
jgi:putative hydrolase of the HAD superfamily